MSQPLLPQLTHALHHPRALPALLRTLHTRAPATSATLLSLLLSYLANAAWLDYTLYRSLGTGGLAPGGVLGWLVHTFCLRPLAMARGREIDAKALPLADGELMGGRMTLEGLQERGTRPRTFGLMPHRQLEEGRKEGTEEYQVRRPRGRAWGCRQPPHQAREVADERGHTQAILAHVNHLAAHNTSLTRSLSVLEAHTAPSLQVTHAPAASRATSLSQLFLSGLHAPRSDASSASREFAHLHAHDGSMHVVLAPQDAALLLERRWGELHRLAGVAYRGSWWPPVWLPLPISAAARWAYLHDKARKGEKAKILPPTYCLVYAPRSREEVESVKMVLNAAATFALGHPPQL
jgi:hypothetical protein